MIQRSRNATSFWSIVVLLLCLAIVNGVMLWSGGRLYFGAAGSDLVSHFFPRHVFVCRWLQRGVFPFWDMHAFGGYPVVETQQHAMFHPVSLLTSLFFSPSLGLNLTMAGYISIGIVASYLALARGRCFRKPAAALATLLFFFGGAMATRVAAAHFAVVGATAMWIPALASLWALMSRLQLTGFWRNPRRFASPFAGAVLANALVILAGSPQYVVYLFYVELLAVLAICYRRGVHKGAFFKGFLALFCVWGWAILLAAPQWLPTLFYLPFTGRSHGNMMLPPSAHDRWNFLLELCLPFPLGDDLTRAHLHFKNVWETCTYPGMIAIILGAMPFIGMRRWRMKGLSPKIRIAWGVLLLGVYLCWGGWLPGFSSFREPLKARAIVALGLALAAGAGWEWLAVFLRFCRARAVKNVRSALVFLAILPAAIGMVAILVMPHYAESFGRWLLASGIPIDSGRSEAWQYALAHPAQVVEGVAQSCRVVVGWSLLMGLFVAAFFSKPRLCGLLVLTAAVLEPFSTHVRAFVSRHSYSEIKLPEDFANAITRELQRTKEENRLPWRVSLPPSLANRGHLIDGLWETGGYDPLMPREANNRVALETEATPIPLDDLRTTVSLALGRRFDFSHWVPEMGEKFGELSRYEVASRASLFSFEQRLRAGYSGVYGFGPSVRGVHFVDEVPPSESGREVSPRVREWVEKVVASGGEANAELVNIPVATPNEYALKIRCGAPGLVLLRTTWLPGWQAWLDGKYWGRPWCANRWMLAVPVESGEHEIRFRYRPMLFRESLVVALGASLGLFMAFVIVKKGKSTRRA